MVEYFGRLAVTTYFLFVGYLGSVIVSAFTIHKIAPEKLVTFGLLILLAAVMLAIWTRLSMACVNLALVGLMIDDAGIAQLAGPDWLMNLGLALSPQAIYLLLVALLLAKRSERMRGAKAGAAIMP